MDWNGVCGVVWNLSRRESSGKVSVVWSEGGVWALFVEVECVSGVRCAGKDCPEVVCMCVGVMWAECCGVCGSRMVGVVWIAR